MKILRVAEVTGFRTLDIRIEFEQAAMLASSTEFLRLERFLLLCRRLSIEPSDMPVHDPEAWREFAHGLLPAALRRGPPSPRPERPEPAPTLYDLPQEWQRPARRTGRRW